MWPRLAIYMPDDLHALDDWVVKCQGELKHAPELLRALWERSDLLFPDPPMVKNLRYLRISSV